MKKRSPSSHVINTLLACGVLYWVLDLSAADRGVIDFIVIGLVSGAIGWNLVQLGRQLHRPATRRDP